MTLCQLYWLHSIELLEQMCIWKELAMVHLEILTLILPEATEKTNKTSFMIFGSLTEVRSRASEVEWFSDDKL
jgi:hypothetical protein